MMEGNSVLKKRKRGNSEEGDDAPPKKKRKADEQDWVPEEEEEDDDDDDLQMPDFVVRTRKTKTEGEEESTMKPLRNPDDKTSLTYRVLKVLKDAFLKEKQQWMTIPEVMEELRLQHPKMTINRNRVVGVLTKCVLRNGAKKRVSPRYGLGLGPRNLPFQEYRFDGDSKMPRKVGRPGNTPGINRSAAFLRVLKEEGRWMSGREVEQILALRYKMSTSRKTAEVSKRLSSIFLSSRGILKRRKRDRIYEYLYIRQDGQDSENYSPPRKESTQSVEEEEEEEEEEKEEKEEKEDSDEDREYESTKKKNVKKVRPPPRAPVHYHMQDRHPPPRVEDDEEYSDTGPNALFYAALFGKYNSGIPFVNEKKADNNQKADEKDKKQGS